MSGAPIGLNEYLEIQENDSKQIIEKALGEAKVEGYKTYTRK